MSDRGPLAGGWKFLRADFIDALSSLSMGPVRGIEADPAGPEEGPAADRPSRGLYPLALSCEARVARGSRSNIGHND